MTINYIAKGNMTSVPFPFDVPKGNIMESVETYISKAYPGMVIQEVDELVDTINIYLKEADVMMNTMEQIREEERVGLFEEEALGVRTKKEASYVIQKMIDVDLLNRQEAYESERNDEEPTIYKSVLNSTDYRKITADVLKAQAVEIARAKDAGIKELDLYCMLDYALENNSVKSYEPIDDPAPAERSEAEEPSTEQEMVHNVNPKEVEGDNVNSKDCEGVAQEERPGLPSYEDLVAEVTRLRKKDEERTIKIKTMMSDLVKIGYVLTSEGHVVKKKLYDSPQAIKCHSIIKTQRGYSVGYDEQGHVLSVYIPKTLRDKLVKENKRPHDSICANQHCNHVLTSKEVLFSRKLQALSSKFQHHDFCPDCQQRIIQQVVGFDSYHKDYKVPLTFSKQLFQS